MENNCTVHLYGYSSNLFYSVVFQRLTPSSNIFSKDIMFKDIQFIHKKMNLRTVFDLKPCIFLNTSHTILLLDIAPPFLLDSTFQKNELDNHFYQRQFKLTLLLFDQRILSPEFCGWTPNKDPRKMREKQLKVWERQQFCLIFLSHWFISVVC